MGNETTLGALVGIDTAIDIGKSWRAGWEFGFGPRPQVRKVRMLRVTVVLFADDDGKRATGVLKQGGFVMPVSPWLRNPAIHKKATQSYIDDLISLANKQLFVSGADFLLDRANVRYVLEKNTAVNSRNSEATLALIAKKQAARGANSWRDSILLLFPWGAGDASHPSGSGMSDVLSPYIQLAVSGYGTELVYDGVPVAGNIHLTHELGHYLGLPHNFPGVANEIVDVLDRTLNPLGLPLTEANLPKFNGLVKDDIPKLRKKVKDAIAAWPYSLEQDSFAWNPELFPADLAVTDTPVNLGMGLPAVMGDPIGSGEPTYEIEHLGKKKTVAYDADVRLNVMGYWYTEQYGQRFSPKQVARMKHAVDTVRKNVVDRTVTVQVTVGKKSITVTEDVFSVPPLLLQLPQDLQLSIRKPPTQRQIAAALSRLERSVPQVMPCRVGAPRVRVRA